MPHPHPIKLNPGLVTSNTAGEIHYVHDECGGTFDGFDIELGPHIDVDVASSGEVLEIQAFSSNYGYGQASTRRPLSALFLALPLISAHPPAHNPHFSNAFASVNLRVMASFFFASASSGTQCLGSWMIIKRNTGENMHLCSPEVTTR